MLVDGSAVELAVTLGAALEVSVSNCVGNGVGVSEALAEDDCEAVALVVPVGDAVDVYEVEGVARPVDETDGDGVGKGVGDVEVLAEGEGVGFTVCSGNADAFHKLTGNSVILPAATALFSAATTEAFPNATTNLLVVFVVVP
jgi:hypothetical protein